MQQKAIIKRGWYPLNCILLTNIDIICTNVPAIDLTSNDSSSATNS